jgi:hypothetical protein
MVEHIPVMLKEVIESLKNVESPQMIVESARRISTSCIS